MTERPSEDELIERQLKLMQAHGVMYAVEHALRVLVCHPTARYALTADQLRQLEDTKKMLALASMNIRPVCEAMEDMPKGKL